MSLSNPAGVGASLRTLGILAGVFLVFGGTQAAGPLTLDEARRLAEAANPTLRAAQAGLAAAEGQVRDSRGILWNNPQLATDLARRRAAQIGLADQTLREHSVGLAQTFELAGQQGHRRDAAQKELAATREGIEETRRQVRAEVERRFIRVLSLQRRIETERAALRLIEEAAAAVGKRVAAGEDTRLDGNLAAVEAERGRNQLTLLNEQLIQARADLAAALQLPPDSLPEAAGDLAAGPPPYTLDELLASAAGRPLLRTLELREQAGRSRLELERASAYPDLTVGLSTAREAEPDVRYRLTTLSISLPLPLFRRNATGIGRAGTELTQAQIERQTAVRDTRAQVLALWQRLASQRARVQRLGESVLPSLEENQRLAAIAYRAGEIGLLQLLLVNRQALDARRDMLDVVGDFALTRVELEQAAGWSGEKGGAK